MSVRENATVRRAPRMSGVTLLEMLIVLVLMAILAIGMAYYIFQTARDARQLA